jgi:acetyl esterase
MGRRLITAIALIAALVGASWFFNPWPSALFYRILFDRGGVALNEALAKHAPPNVKVLPDVGYGADPIETLDLYFPADSAGSERAWPVVLWIHGGGFLSGDKSQISNYLKIFAASGYAVAGINYTLAPAARHPTPTRQANMALAYLQKNAENLNIAPTRIILAGDSAGSQIAAQLGLAITEPMFARSIGIEPAIQKQALRGLVLHCGIYDADLLDFDGALGGFLKTVA